MNKKELSESDICAKYITPAILKAGWIQHESREVFKAQNREDIGIGIEAWVG